MRKNIRQTQTEGHSTKYLTSNPWNYQVHEKQEKLRTHYRPEEAKET